MPYAQKVIILKNGINKSLFDRINFYMKRIIFALMSLTLFSALFNLITDKLVIGGRWGTGLFLGGVDNWLAGGSMYDLPDPAITSGPVYSPGGLFISLIARMIFGFDAQTFVVILGGIVAILLLWGFVSLMNLPKRTRIWGFFAISFIFIVDFPWVKFYVFEMHPDLYVLACFVWGLLMINRFLKCRSIISLLLATLLFYFAGLFKQNAAILFVGLGLFVITSKELARRDKLLVLASEAIAGVCVIITMLSIDGCWYNCVELMASHHMISLQEYWSYLKGALINNKLFILIIICYLILLTKGIINVTAVAERMWLFSSVAWFLFCMYGAAKVGSNNGNIEVAVIALLPLVFPVLFMIYSKAKVILGSKWGKVLFIGKYFLIFSCFIIICINSVHSINNITNYNNRIDSQKKFIQWLNSNYSNCNIAYNAEIYECLNGANVNKKTDLFVVDQRQMGNLINDTELNQLSQKENWEIIITTSDYSEGSWPKTFSHFKKLSVGEFPEVPVHGGIMEVFVKNNSTN